MLTRSINVTRRELEIIWAISHGMSSEEISQKCFISVHTVQTHRRNIMQKLEARNTAHLVRLGFEKGLLEQFEIMRNFDQLDFKWGHKQLA